MESLVYKKIFMSQNNLVGIVTGYDLLDRGSIPGEETNIPYSTAPRPAEANLISDQMDAEDTSP
jgi:hypothetical protein